jgi:hypothetical protein
VNQRSNFLRAALTAALLATTATAGARSGACDPMYPCYTDAGTPAAVYDLTARAPTALADHASDAASTPALTTKGLGGEQFEDHPHYRIGGNAHAAVYDLAVRTDDAPCESYPCYPETHKAATPIAAEAGATQRAVDPRS